MISVCVLTGCLLGFGGMPAPRHDLRRWVKWPRYIRIQRQRASLWMRLRVPPAINQFTYTLERNQAYSLFRLLLKYRPETRKAKQLRLQKEAEERTKGMEVCIKKNILFAATDDKQIIPARFESFDEEITSPEALMLFAR